MVSPLEPGIVCIDLDSMLAFYTDVLGLKFISDAEATPQMSTEFGTSPDGFKIIRLQTPYGERIKLVQPQKTVLKKSPPSGYLKGRALHTSRLSLPMCMRSRRDCGTTKCR